MNQPYDSTAATLTHIRKVNANIIDFCTEMLRRAKNHDESKLHEPEKSILDEYTPKLYSTTYMSDEYKACLEGMKIMIAHHEQNNTHHPGYYTKGIDGMNLFDLIEMYCDWKAASERIPGGNIEASLETNKSRFNVSEQLYNIFKNTKL